MLSAGERLGTYTLVEPRGTRGVCELWQVRASDGSAAVMTAGRLRHASQEGKLRERLTRELGVLKRLEHPNLERVLDAGTERGWHYVVTELIDGVSLESLLARHSGQRALMDPLLAAFVVQEVARGWSHVEAVERLEGTGPARSKRELSPSGVMLARSGAVKLADLVIVADTQDLVETAGQTLQPVTPYLSPETARGGPRDARSDVYSLGVILWELLAGRFLFRRDTDLATLEAIRSDEVPPFPPGVPIPLARIAASCLSRKPEERFASPSALIAELERVLFGHKEVGASQIAALVADSSKRHTAMLSAQDQGAGDRTLPSDPPVRDPSVPPAPAPQRTLQSDPPSEAVRAGAQMRATQPSDPFFDPMRDGGPISNPRFEVLGRLGSGGMGEVYRVRDQELNEVVALKVIPPSMAGDPATLERLRREVRLARRIPSEHVCRIFDIVDLGNGNRGLTMAVVQGVTLSELMKSGVKLDYQRFARWGAEVAEGLAAAHGLSIVHRDLKPENIMIRQDDSAVILDFGIARTAADAPDPADLRLTKAGIIMGTPLYMSPEQLTNRPLDSRSDLYALGLILAELITGEVPLKGDSYGQILEERVLKARTFELKGVDPAVPEALAEVIDSLLRAAAGERPATATLVEQQLRRVAEGKPSGDGPVSGTSIPKGVATPDRPQPRARSLVPRSASSAGRPGRKISRQTVLLVILVVYGAASGLYWARHRARPAIAPIAPLAPDAETLGSAPLDAGATEPAPPDAGAELAPPPPPPPKKPPPPPVIEEM